MPIVPGYELTIHAGQNRTLVVAFAGMLNPKTGEVRFEWIRSLRAASPDTHVILVKDNNSQWYTRPQGRQEIVDAIAAYIRDNGIESSLALGLSMGGYGALVFSTLLHFDHVVALSCRSSVDAAGGFDRRNAALIDTIEDTPHSRVLDVLDPSTDYCFVSSLDRAADLAHLALIVRGFPGARTFLTRGDHNLVREMNRRGRGAAFTRWVLGLCRPPAPPGVSAFDPPARQLGVYLSMHDLRIDRDAWHRRFQHIGADRIPQFVLEETLDAACREQLYPGAAPCPLYLFDDGQALHRHIARDTSGRDAVSVSLGGVGGDLVIRGHVLDARNRRRYDLQIVLDADAGAAPELPMAIEAEVDQAPRDTSTVSGKALPCRIVLPLTLPDRCFSVRLRPACREAAANGRAPGIRLVGFHVEPVGGDMPPITSQTKQARE